MQTTKFFIVIDTNLYSGNFERQMAGFVTGACGETHGDEEAKLFSEELSEGTIDSAFAALPGKVAVIAEEYGEEAGHLYPTEGRFNNGHGGHFDVDDPAAAEITTRFPAYESVAIYFDVVPTENELSLIALRAKEYADYYNERGTFGSPPKASARMVIKGVRFVTQENNPTQTVRVLA